MDYDFQFSSAYFDREKNCRKMDMIRSDSFIKEIKAQFDTQEHVMNIRVNPRPLSILCYF